MFGIIAPHLFTNERYRHKERLCRYRFAITRLSGYNTSGMPTPDIIYIYFSSVSFYYIFMLLVLCVGEDVNICRNFTNTFIISPYSYARQLSGVGLMRVSKIPVTYNCAIERPLVGKLYHQWDGASCRIISMPLYCISSEDIRDDISMTFRFSETIISQPPQPLLFLANAHAYAFWDKKGNFSSHTFCHFCSPQSAEAHASCYILSFIIMQQMPGRHLRFTEKHRHFATKLPLLPHSTFW